MTAKNLADLCLRIYSGGDPSNNGGLLLVDFENAVKDACAYKIIKDYWDSSRLEGERTVNNAWVQMYKNVPVLLDESLDMYYSVLPQEPLNIPVIGGIQTISPMQNLSATFKKTTVGGISLFTKNPIFTTYYYDNTKIYYQNIDPVYGKSGVLLNMIPAIQEEIPDSMAYEIRELVLNQFGKNRTLNDKIDDQNPNQKDNVANPNR